MSAENWTLFAQFCQAELATGGPDPQVPLMAYLSGVHLDNPPVERGDLENRVWLAGCYGAHHCVGSAYAVWKEWPYEKVIADVIDVEIWLEENWKALPVRPEMRSHRMPQKRAKCLEGFANYANNFDPWKQPTYDIEWQHSIASVPYYNRYMAIKFLEMLRLMVPWPQLAIPDMRARGAWSPRIALGMMWPDVNHILADKSKNGPEHVRMTEEFASKTRHILHEEYGVSVNFFQLQVLLCEFREALVGGYYPGASLDEEMEYLQLVEENFDMSDVWAARKAIFPHEYLGELNGWHGLRKEKFTAFKGAAKYERVTSASASSRPANS